MVSNETVRLVEDAAVARDNPKLPRQFIEKALELIESGAVTVERCSTGELSLPGVYVVAADLYGSAVGTE